LAILSTACACLRLPAQTNCHAESPDGLVGRHTPHEQMMGNLLLFLLIFVVSVISGMLGIGVAFGRFRS
jgi:hypothetical protein